MNIYNDDWMKNAVFSVESLCKGKPRKFDDLTWQARRGDPWFDEYLNVGTEVYGFIHFEGKGTLGLDLEVRTHGEQYLLMADITGDDGFRDMRFLFEETLGDEEYICGRIYDMAKGMELLMGV